MWKILILESITEGAIWFCLVGGDVFTEKLTHELTLKSQKASFKLWLFTRNSLLLLLLSSWQPYGLHHAKRPWLSLSPGVWSNSCPLSWWCYPTISSSAAPLLLLPSIFPSVRVFSNESALHIRWLKYWSFSFSSSPSSDYSGLLFFRIDWFDLLAVQGTLFFFFSFYTSLYFQINCSYVSLQGTLKSLFSTTTQKHQFFGVQPSLWSNSHICTWLLEKPCLWLYRPLAATWCLCFLICCLGLS